MRLAFFVASLLIGASVFAQTQPSILENVQLNGEQTEYTALVTVNQEEAFIQVEIVNDICGSLKPADGMMHCLAMPVSIRALEVPLQKSEKSCGSEIFSGKEDRRPVDGNYVSIQVVDHSKRMCMDMQPSSVIVKAVVKSARGGSDTYLISK